MNTCILTRGPVVLATFAVICLLLHCMLACGTAHVSKISLDPTDEKVFDWQSRPDIVAAVEVADAYIKSGDARRKGGPIEYTKEVYEGKTSVQVIYLPASVVMLGGDISVFVSKANLSILAVIAGQ